MNWAYDLQALVERSLLGPEASFVQVKGIAVLARREVTLRMRDEATWDRMLAQLGAEDPFFRETILATSLVPIDKFLRLNERIIDVLYSGDLKGYSELGGQAARFAAGPGGPYGIFLASTDLKRIVEVQWPKFWRSYLGTDSVFESKFEGREAQTRFAGLPVKHPYFEFFIVAYYRTTLQLAGYPSVALARVKGWDSSDGEIVYRYLIGPRRVGA